MIASRTLQRGRNESAAKLAALAQARHPNAPVCPGCKWPIVPGTLYPAGRKPRHFGC